MRILCCREVNYKNKIKSIFFSFFLKHVQQLCCERSYTPQDLQPHLGNIWHGMRREIFMGGNDDVERKCYEFLKSAFRMISQDSTILNTCLSMIYSGMTMALNEYLPYFNFTIQKVHFVLKY